MRRILVVLSLGLVAGCADMQVKETEEAPRSRVFVANESSNSVTVVDGDSFQVIATVDARNHATHDLAVSRDGRWLFATNLASGRLSAINTRALETVASIATASASRAESTAAGRWSRRSNWACGRWPFTWTMGGMPSLPRTISPTWSAAWGSTWSPTSSTGASIAA